MRQVPTEDWELKELAKLEAESWMVAQLACIPSYCSWSPGDDAMPSNSGDNAWFGGVFDSWAEFRDGEDPDELGGGGWRRPDGSWGLDNTNVCASFYFEIDRDSERCPDCPEGGEGYNPATAKIAESYLTWRYQLEQRDLDALIAERRIPQGTTLAELNYQGGDRDIGNLVFRGHFDAISRHVLVEARATRAGVYGMCPTCDGSTYRYIAPARLDLVLWMLYPRKGASAATTIRNLSREDCREARDFLREAARQNAERFGQLEEPNDATADDVSDERYRKTEEIAVAWMDRADRWRRGGLRKASGT